MSDCPRGNRRVLPSVNSCSGRRLHSLPLEVSCSGLCHSRWGLRASAYSSLWALCWVQRQCRPLLARSDHFEILTRKCIAPEAECLVVVRRPNLCLKRRAGEECGTCSSWRIFCARCDSCCANFLIMQERLGRRHSLASRGRTSFLLCFSHPFLVPVAF